MDINMPDMDGIQATENIRKAVPFAQIIILSVQGDPSYMRRAMMAGACDFITKPPAIEELTAAIRRAGVRAHEEKAKSRVLPVGGDITPGVFSMTPAILSMGKVIVVYSPKGGVGCTTIATNLAVGLNNDETPVLLVDANMQFGDVAVFLNEQGKNSVVDLASRVDELDNEVVNGVLLTHAPSGLRILPGPFRPEHSENITADQFIKLINFLRRMFSYIIIDTASTLNDLTLGTIQEAADLIVLVTTQEIPSIKNCRLFLDLADQLNINRRQIIFTMNRFDKRIGITPEKVGESFKQEILAALPFDDRTVIPSVNRGSPLLLTDKSKPISRALLSLTEIVRQKLSEMDAREEPLETAKVGGGKVKTR
jgi:pilus assembly protein CpaE